MATHSSILAWKIPWMEEPGRLQSMRSQRGGHDWATSLHFTSLHFMCIYGFPSGTSSKESVCQCRRPWRHRLNPWFGVNPWSRKWQPNPFFLPEKSHGQRRLAGYSPRGHKESDMTERLSMHIYMCVYVYSLYIWVYFTLSDQSFPELSDCQDFSCKIKAMNIPWNYSCTL